MSFKEDPMEQGLYGPHRASIVAKMGTFLSSAESRKVASVLQSDFEVSRPFLKKSWETHLGGVGSRRSCSQICLRSKQTQFSSLLSLGE